MSDATCQRTCGAIVGIFRESGVLSNGSLALSPSGISSAVDKLGVIGKPLRSKTSALKHAETFVHGDGTYSISVLLCIASYVEIRITADDLYAAVCRYLTPAGQVIRLHARVKVAVDRRYSWVGEAFLFY